MNKLTMIGIGCLLASATILGSVFNITHGQNGILDSYAKYKITKSSEHEAMMVEGAQWILDNQPLIILGTMLTPLGAMFTVIGVNQVCSKNGVRA